MAGRREVKSPGRPVRVPSGELEERPVRMRGRRPQTMAAPTPRQISSLRMSDPHVELLRYRFVSVNEQDVFDSAASMAFTEDGFDLRLAGGVLEVRPLSHYASVEDAAKALEPVLTAWEAHARLELARREIRFELINASSIDRATGRPLVSAFAHRAFGFGVAAIATVPNATYPAPPTSFRSDPVLESVLARLSELDAGRAPITHAANWVVTRIEDTYGMGAGGSNTRRKAARTLGLAHNIVDRLARLADQNDPRFGRKAKGPEVFLSDNEIAWMRAAIVLIAQQIGQLNAGAPLVQKTLPDVPVK